MKKISYYLFSHNALLTLVKDIISIVEKAPVAELGLQVFLDIVKAKFANYESAVTRDKVNPYTAKLNEADQERDDRFIGFKSYVAACKYRKSRAWLEAAEEIEKLVAHHGSELYRMANAEESAALDNLIADLMSEAYHPFIAKIKAEDWLNEMNKDQLVYKALIQEQVEQTDRNTNSLENTKKPLIMANRALLSMIELQQTAINNPALGELVDQLNNHISKSMANARLSHSLNENEKEADQEALSE